MKIKPKLKKYVKGGEVVEKKKIEESFVDANNFLKNWQQSPMYNEMLNNSSTGEEYSKISNYRNKSLNLNPVDNLNVEKTLLHNPNTTGFVRKGIPVVNISSDWHNNNEMLSNLKTESDSLKVRLGEIPDYKIPTNFVTPSTIVHEMSHITDWKGLPKTDLQKIKNFSSDRDKNKFSNYVANPSETRSRLNEIRYENSLLKYYNPLTEKINKDQYNNYLKDKSRGNALKDLKNVYSDDEIIDMLNSISENKSSQEQIPIARNGGSIKEFGNGGRQPIIVNDKNDPRLQAYNDSLDIYNKYPNNKYPVEDKFSTLSYVNNNIKQGKDSKVLYPNLDFANQNKIKPTKLEWAQKGYGNFTDEELKKGNWVHYISNGSSAAGVTRYFTYKKPVQPIIYQENRPKEPTFELNQEQQYLPQEEQRLEFDPIGLKKGTYFTRPRQQQEAGQGKLDYFDSKTGKLIKTKQFGNGGKEIKKAENFFKRENKKNPERFGEHYAKDEKTLKDNKNSIDFLNNWYKDRLPFLYGEEKGNELLNSEDFKNNLRGDNPVKYGEVSSRTLAYYPNFQKKPVVTKNFNFRKDFLKNEHNILQVEEEILNKNRSVYIQDKDAVKNDPTILTHENSHKYDIFLPDIFSKDKQIIENTPHSIKPFKNKATYQDFYITTPTEVKSRLMQIRQKYNLSPTQTITQEDLKNFDPTFQPVDELKRYYNDDEFIELLNKVSENKPSQEQLPMARNGGSIKQFTNGGKYEWSKKDMTKTYPVTQTNSTSSITTGNKKLSAEELKKAAEYTKQYNQKHLEEEYNNRQSKLKASVDAQKQPLSLKNLQTQTQSTGDKFSLAMNTKYGNPKDYPTLSGYMEGLDYINPAKIIGDMSSGIGSVPQDVKDGNYLKAGISIGTPLFAGAVAGIGTKGIKPFVNNLTNPLAGTGEIIDNLGNKYLPNSYKLNPFAFKPNPNNFYRQVDNQTFQEGLESGLIKGKQDVDKTRGESIINLNKSFGNDAYYNKGSLYYKDNTNLPYLFEANLPEEKFIPKVNGRTRKYTTENTSVRVSKEPLSIDNPDITIYKKNWLKGYKEVPKPQQTFKSEINWGKWNKEIPENTQLLEEYNTIEQTSKANGSWMKNPDGSPFQGTPEQFVQQNSQNFKKAFGNSKLINPDGSPTIQYHGSAKKFDTFDESKFQLGDSGYSGKGIYTTPDKNKASSYALSSKSIHTGEYEPTVYELYGQGNNPISAEDLIKQNKDYDLFNFHRQKDWRGDVPLEEQLLDYDVAIRNQTRGIERIAPWHQANELVFPTNKQVKSAIGNNGMFDMTNPNIYKALFPAAIGLGAASQIDKKEFGGNIITENDKPVKLGYGGSISYKDFKKKYKDL